MSVRLQFDGSDLSQAAAHAANHSTNLQTSAAKKQNDAMKLLSAFRKQTH
jgi:hypothetical protein